MEVQITVYNRKVEVAASMYVEQLSENTFRMTENDLFDYRLVKDVEFQTKLNKDNQHEVFRILKKSDYITRRFLLPLNYNVNDYRMLGDELMSRGGFWQVDFGGFLTVNIPLNFEFDIDQIIKELDLKVTEIR